MFINDYGWHVKIAKMMLRNMFVLYILFLGLENPLLNYSDPAWVQNRMK